VTGVGVGAAISEAAAAADIRHTTTMLLVPLSRV
jgi:hypothetical protein